MIKEAVLGSIRLNPGVYGERFRNVKKRLGNSYLEMARDRWMKAEGAYTYEEMREVFLMEHFMGQLAPNLKHDLIFHEVRDVIKAGRKADDYCEAHGLSKGEHRGAKKPFSYKGGNG